MTVEQMTGGQTAVKAVIFDFGGVLMRTADALGRREWDERLGLAHGSVERLVHGSGLWIKAQRGLLSHEAYWHAIAENLGVAEADIPQLQRDYFRDDQLDRSLIDLIGELRTAGYKVGLLSNDSAQLAIKLRDELAIFEAFDSVIISSQIGVMKPDPGAYQAVCKMLDVQPNESVFIDDMPANLDGAQAIGMQTIHYRAGMDLRAALQALIGLF